MQNTVTWRAVEAIAHRLANQNPNQYFRVWLENTETDYSEDITLHSSTRGQLSDKSVIALRRSREIIDGGEDFDGCRAYTIEFMGLTDGEPTVVLSLSRGAR